MEGIWIIIAIVWIILPIIAKKKKQQAQEQAARERAARQRAAEAAAQKQAEATVKPMRTTPLAPTVRPAALPVFEGAPSVEGTGSSEGTGSHEGTASHHEGTAKHTIASKLRELNQSPQHVVSASSISGHAHQETSMTGIRPDCPPDVRPAASVVVPVAAESAFVWDQTQALNGIVLSEILGPCLAMRD
jgi:hypothetical protein